MNCRSCNAKITEVLVDLGVSPLSNSYLTESHLNAVEPHYPLKVYLCSECWLAQLPAAARPEEIFHEYAYFSSYSESWLRHSEAYVEMITRKLGLGRDHFVIELASNDGYLLQYFVQRGIPVLGIEPAANVADYARKKGVRTEVKFFGVDTAKE